MILRGNIFIKIFLGFWLVSVAVLGSWLVADHYFQTQPVADVPDRPPGPPHRFLLRMIYELQNTPADALPGTTCPHAQAAASGRVRIEIDRQLCQGHAMCMGEAPELFQVDAGGEVSILQDEPGPELLAKARAARRHCPNSAIRLLDLS